MLLLNGVPLSPDDAFESNGVLYPPGWVRTATPQARAAAGITEEADEPQPDSFYANVYPNPNAPWTWIATPYTPDEMKPRLKTYSRQQRESRELAGVEHTVAGKVRKIPTDPATRAVFFDYRVIAARPDPPKPVIHDFRDELGGSDVISVPEAQMVAIEQRMENRISGCARVQLELQVGIEAETVTTKEQIEQAYAAVP